LSFVTLTLSFVTLSLSFVILSLSKDAEGSLVGIFVRCLVAAAVAFVMPQR
jgi:hypothetical protein